LQTINEQLKSNFYEHRVIKTELETQLNLLENNETTPFEAANYLLEKAKIL